MLKIYCARSMTGRIKEDVVKEATSDKFYFEQWDFTILCPVISEKVESTKQTLVSSRKAMEEYWPRDKSMIREANVVFDLTPELKSEGVAHEIGYARYALWKPVIRIYRNGKLPLKSSVAHFEDDYLASSLEDAAGYVDSHYGTFWKRLKWRLSLLNRCLLKWMWYQLKEFK